ncbi:MAG: RnfABCDGE type electron transport complex subunit B [Clostridia bacterium]|nr:RnfABCDGE type electron transport complex subunit B [Clostridia bacterium]
MLPQILIALAIVGGIGLIAAILLAISSYFFNVPEDETVIKVRACLPGANCGACGYAGCDEYAKAVVKDNAKTNLCIPGADSVAAEVAEIMGVSAEDVIEMVAVVSCTGNCEATQNKALYQGVNTCKAASMIYGGPASCVYGCLGCGDCANVCPYNAICVKDGLAYINRNLCLGCGLCVKQCPKGIIKLVPTTVKTLVLCSNKEKGAVARKNCKNACIGCKKCELVCPEEAIRIENNLSYIDYDKCTRCGKCAENCPTGCIKCAD